MRDEYTVVLERNLAEANEKIGALVSCLEGIIDGDKRMEKIARTIISDIRARRGQVNEVDN